MKHYFKRTHKATGKVDYIPINSGNRFLFNEMGQPYKSKSDYNYSFEYYGTTPPKAEKPAEIKPDESSEIVEEKPRKPRKTKNSDDGEKE